MTDWRDEDEVEGEVARTAFFAMTDSILDDPQSAIKVLAITVTGEIGLLAFVFVSKDEAFKFLESGDSVWIYASIGLFLIGFLTPFAAFRLLPRRIRQRFFTYTIWLVSIAAGLGNIGLFYMLFAFRMR